MGCRSKRRHCVFFFQGQLGDWDGALEGFNRALGTAGVGGASETAVPPSAPFAGLRGGAAKLGQRLELHAALARLASGDAGGAVQALQAVDKGPNPNGFPQFWDARAALAVAFYAAGRKDAAELEWAELCQPAPPPPPAIPSNPVLARVNKTAQVIAQMAPKAVPQVYGRGGAEGGSKVGVRENGGGQRRAGGCKHTSTDEPGPPPRFTW